LHRATLDVLHALTPRAFHSVPNDRPSDRANNGSHRTFTAATPDRIAEQATRNCTQGGASTAIGLLVIDLFGAANPLRNGNLLHDGRCR
jgi:hypothetical protein